METGRSNEIPGSVFSSRSSVIVLVIFFPFFFEFQLTKFVRKADAEGAVSNLPVTVHDELLSGKFRSLGHVFVEGIGGGKSNTSLLMPYLFFKRQTVGGKRRIFPLHFVAGRIEIAEKFGKEGFIELIGSVEVNTVIVTIGRTAGNEAVVDVLIEK